MKSETVFRDIERTESLERYLFGQTEGLVNRCFGPETRPHLVVKVSIDRHRKQGGANHYACEILLTLKDHSPVIKVSKSGYDFYDCVAEAGATLRLLIRRRHSQEVDDIRHVQALDWTLDWKKEVV